MKLSQLGEDITQKLQEDILRALDRNQSLIDDKAEREVMLMMTAVGIISAMAEMEQEGTMPASEFRSPQVKPTTYMDFFTARCADLAILQMRIRQKRGQSL